MLKQKNRTKISALAVSAIVVLVGAIILPQMIHAQIVQNSSDQRPFGLFSKYLPAKHPPPISLSELYGSDFPSIGAADQATGLPAKVATYVPSGLELKTIKTKIGPIGDPSRMVTIIYAPKQVSFDAKTTMYDVLDHNGIIALYMTDLFTGDRAKWMNDYIASIPSTHEITIHGEPAVGTNGIPQNGMKSQVIFFEGNTEVILFSVGYSESDLIKIAESMQ